MICRLDILTNEYQAHFLECREQLINRTSKYQKDSSGKTVTKKRGCGCKNKKLNR